MVQPTSFVKRVLRSPGRTVGRALLVTALASASCLNPDIVNKNTSRLYPLAPGDQPYVLVTLLNDTTATLNTTLLVDTGRTTPTVYTIENLTPEFHTFGILVPYPFLRLALGNLDNAFAPAISATLPSGLTVQVPFGQSALVAGTDFQKGDTIIFDFVADARAATAISISTGIVAGTTQTGPFTRSDTFQTVSALLVLNGLSTTATTTP